MPESDGPEWAAAVAIAALSRRASRTSWRGQLLDGADVVGVRNVCDADQAIGRRGVTDDEEHSSPALPDQSLTLPRTKK